jgi:hypothetical protein
MSSESLPRCLCPCRATLGNPTMPPEGIRTAMPGTLHTLWCHFRLGREASMKGMRCPACLSRNVQLKANGKLSDVETFVWVWACQECGHEAEPEDARESNQCPPGCILIAQERPVTPTDARCPNCFSRDISKQEETWTIYWACKACKHTARPEFFYNDTPVGCVSISQEQPYET